MTISASSTASKRPAMRLSCTPSSNRLVAYQSKPSAIRSTPVWASSRNSTRDTCWYWTPGSNAVIEEASFANCFPAVCLLNSVVACAIVIPVPFVCGRAACVFVCVCLGALGALMLVTVAPAPGVEDGGGEDGGVVPFCVVVVPDPTWNGVVTVLAADQRR